MVDSDGVAGIHGVDGENEDIRVRALAFEDAYQLLINGTIRDAASIISLQWLMINRKKLGQTSDADPPFLA